MFVLIYANTRTGMHRADIRGKNNKLFRYENTSDLRDARYNYLKNIPTVVFAVLPEKVFFA